MSYFAVLHEEPGRLEVKHCHINLWQLGSRKSDSVLFDVGLALRFRTPAGATAVGPRQADKLQLALPFRADSGVDIQDVLRHSETASLVFGQPVDVQNGGESLKIGSEVLELTCCTVTEQEELRIKGGSVWGLTLAKPIQNQATLYLRVRFRANRSGAMSQFTGSGQLIDFRVADTRGSVSDRSWKGLESKFVPLSSLNVFAIAPAEHSVLSSHPPFQYVRLLEAQTWLHYLQDRRFGKKMVVYYWRVNAPERPVCAEAPFRAFLHLGESRRAHLMRERTLATGLSAIATVALLKATPFLSDGAVAVWNGLPNLWRYSLAGLASLGFSLEYIFRISITGLLKRAVRKLKKK